MTIGGTLAVGSGGLAAPAGFFVIAHGLDYFITGVRAVISGEFEDTVTTQLLQKTSLSHNMAINIDNGISLIGSMGSMALIRRASQLSFPAFKLPPKSHSISKAPRLNKLGPHAEATGPHTSFKLNLKTGKISGYETYDYNPIKGEWSAKLRFRGTGKPHGKVEPPFILERRTGKGAGSIPIVPRQAKSWELPYGYK